MGDWEAERDARTLIEAMKIRSEPERFAAARLAAKELWAEHLAEYQCAKAVAKDERA